MNSKWLFCFLWGAVAVETIVIAIQSHRQRFHKLVPRLVYQQGKKELGDLHPMDDELRRLAITQRAERERGRLTKRQKKLLEGLLS